MSSELYPVTPGGRVLGFALMLYAVGVFSYFIASIASVLVGLDAGQGTPENRQEDGGVALSEDEIEALRNVLDRAERARR